MNAEIRNLLSLLSHKSLSKSIHCPVYKLDLFFSTSFVFDRYLTHIILINYIFGFGRKFPPNNHTHQQCKS